MCGGATNARLVRLIFVLLAASWACCVSSAASTGGRSGPWEKAPTKWIFSYSSKSQDFDEMLRVAVVSAQENTDLEPICLLYGMENNLTEWLRALDVKIISHRPHWTWKMLALRERLKSNSDWSPLYEDPDRMIATFMRIDIPSLDIQDEYILYTDADVMFTGPIRWQAFGELPSYYTVGTEGKEDEDSLDGNPYGNAGVMLMNLPKLRESYPDFLKFIFSEKSINDGLHFGSFGPGDQGAYNAFYSGKFRVVRSPLFNWKPYWVANSRAFIIHFHGPKASHYEALALKGTTGNKLYDKIIKKTCDISNRTSGCFIVMKDFEFYRSLALISERLPMRKKAGTPTKQEIPDLKEEDKIGGAAVQATPHVLGLGFVLVYLTLYVPWVLIILFCLRWLFKHGYTPTSISPRSKNV